MPKFRDGSKGRGFLRKKRWARAYREPKIDIKINTNNGIEAQNKVFKYNYLSKGTDKTLSGVAKVIVECFCPEQYKLYVLKNLKLNKNIKAYNKEIPEFLHGRPHGFIKHCMQRIHSSAVYTTKDVQDLGELRFQVTSESSKQTYSVDLASPTCSCPDWRKFKCPCKHMFAVFENTSADWYNLPLNYRESSLYTIDKDVNEVECDDDQPEDMEIDDNNTSTHTDKIESSSQDSKNVQPVAVGQLPQKRTIVRDTAKHAANITRATLQQLKELTYLSQDADVLSDVTKELQTLISKLSATVPKSSEGIYIRASPKKSRKENSKRKMEKLKNIGCIAKMKKTGKKRLDWWHRNRVGTRANMLKKMYKVNVPVVTIEDGEQEEQQNFYSCLHATSDNWRNMYRNLLIPAELQCLNPGCLVSDLIIEAFLQYLTFEYADENVKQSTIALSSYFCTKLRSSTHKTITTANGAEKKVPRNDRELWECAKSFTRKVAIWNKNIVLIPVNKGLHWILIVLFNKTNETVKEQPVASSTTIVVFDSMNCPTRPGLVTVHHRHTTDIIMRYLNVEWAARKKLEHDFRSNRVVYPLVPQQPNSVDCGVYVMKFAEMLIKEPLTGEMLMKIPDFRQSFDHAEISAMRERVKSLLSTL